MGKAQGPTRYGPYPLRYRHEVGSQSLIFLTKYKLFFVREIKGKCNRLKWLLMYLSIFLICGNVISSNSHKWDVGKKKLNVVCCFEIINSVITGLLIREKVDFFETVL